MEFLDINGVNKLLTLLKTEIDNKIDEGGGGGGGNLPTLTPNKLVITDNGGNLTTSDTIELSDLENLDGVTANVQEQINNITNNVNENLSDLEDRITALESSGGGGGGSGELPTITGNRVAVSNSAGTIIASGITTTELNNLDNIKSNIQDQIDGKANATHTHELSEIIGHYGDRVIVSFNSSTAYLEESSVTKKELEYLKGCSGYIQTQIDSLDERISSIGGGGSSGGGGTCDCSAIDLSDIETSFNKIMNL